MGLIEGIKDMLGILDDADDFFDKISNILSDVDPLMRKLEGMSEDIKKRLDRVSDTQHPGDIKTLFKRLDINRPIWIGKTVNDRFRSASREVERLKSKLNGLSPDIKGKVLPQLNEVSKRIDAAQKENFKVISQLSGLQEKRKSATASKVLSAGALAAGIAGVAGAAYLVTDLVAQTVLVKAGTSLVRGAATGVRDVISDAKQANASARQELLRNQ